MARLEITVSSHKTGRITAHEIFEMEEETARRFIEQMEQMLAGLNRPVRVIKTISPDGVTTLDITTHRPAAVTPTFETRYRRALPAPREDTVP